MPTWGSTTKQWTVPSWTTTPRKCQRLTWSSVNCGGTHIGEMVSRASAFWSSSPGKIWINNNNSGVLEHLSQMSSRCAHFILKIKTTNIKMHDIHLHEFIKHIPPPFLSNIDTHACTHTHTHTFTWGMLETVRGIRSRREASCNGTYGGGGGGMAMDRAHPSSG